MELDPEPGESWDDFYDRTRYARVAGRDQGVAVVREKIARLLPELDDDPERAKRRLRLVFKAAVSEVGVDALAEVLADYVIRDRDRNGG